MASEYDRAAEKMSADFPRTLGHTLTQHWVRRRIHQAPRFRASSPSGYTFDVLRAAPDQAAHHVLPLRSKVALSGFKPPSFKGAVACCIYKGRGSWALKKSYRTFALNDIMPKLHYAFL